MATNNTYKFLMTVVVPTYNEERNILPCLRSFDSAVAAGWCECLVVDNSSTDKTVALAKQGGAKVFHQAPERSAQRNRGWREASGKYVFFIDADMRVPPETVTELYEMMNSAKPPDAIFIREIRVGNGWWIKVRNFERSFYDATCIDALRVISRDLLQAINGYDESLCGPEDWDLDRRILAKTDNIALTKNALLHDEGAHNLRRHLRKKRYYSKKFDAYQKKWGWDRITRKQFGIWYRFVGVFFENGKWRRVLRHPVMMIAIWFDRTLVGFVYLLRKSDGKTSA